VALINHRAREIHFKIVYYGPSLGGKTTNLKQLHERLPAERRGKMLSIATDHERTLFFDFLPFSLGEVQGYTTRIHLYTTPGQAYYRLSRRAVLQGLDGLVFVADSHPAREGANAESLADLDEHLTAIGTTPEQRDRIAWVFQYNKRDLPAALPVERLRRALNPRGATDFEAVASEGKGISETLRAVCKGVIAQMTPFRKGMSPATDMSDAKTFVAWLDAQPQVNKNRKVGVQGYCMGGPMSFHTASAVPDRIGAVATFHGGNLVAMDPTSPTSPHNLAAATKASFLIAIAENDDKSKPNDKTILKETFDKAKLSSEIEVYPAAHGWCPPDTQVYNEPAAEKAWSRLLALYGKALA